MPAASSRMDWIDPEFASDRLTGEEALAWIQACLAERAPAAVVRFADGEARMLAATAEDSESIEAAVAKLRKETGREYAQDTVLEIKSRLDLAFDRADVLGIRFTNAVSPESRKWLSQLHSLYAERVRAGRPEAIIAPCLVDWATLPQLLAGRRVSAITCRDVKPVLEGEWGAREVSVYQVPSQFLVRDVDGDYEATMHDVPIWPDRHARLREELTVREPGEVFLVGAGLFGKDLCVEVREKGGLALDLGSALDRIVGKVTRGPRRRVHDLNAIGMSPPEIAADLSRVFGVDVSVRRVRQVLGSAEEGQ